MRRASEQTPMRSSDAGGAQAPDCAGECTTALQCTTGAQVGAERTEYIVNAESCEDQESVSEREGEGGRGTETEGEKEDNEIIKLNM